MTNEYRYRIKGRKEHQFVKSWEEIPEDAIDIVFVGEEDYDERAMTKKDLEHQGRKDKWRERWSAMKPSLDYVLKVLTAMAAIIAAIASTIGVLR